jgi:hypothetical protein
VVLEPQVQAAPGKLPLHTVQVAVPVVVRQPLASFPQVARTLPRQTLPAPGQSLGGAGQLQAAPGNAPAQGLPDGQVATLAERHPLASAVQVATLVPRQTVPGPGQSDGCEAQVHVAPGKPPVQVLLEGQVVVPVVVRQPLPSRPQVARMLLALQTVPGPEQSDGPGGQAHWALGALPLHTFPVAQLVRPVTPRQPLLLSAAQVATLVADSQKVPAWPAHPAGGEGQVQAAFELPMHGLPVGQVVRWVTVRQALVSRPHWATVVLDSQKRSWVPLQAAGGAGQVQAALGAVPVQGRPDGQGACAETEMQPLASTAQVTRVFP